MHIVIDVRALQIPGSLDRGLGYSLRGWLQEFLRLPYDHQVTLLMDPRFAAPEIDVPLSGSYWRTVAFESSPVILKMPDPDMQLAATQRTEALLQELRADLFHSPSLFETGVAVGYPPEVCPCVVTFHDALPLLFPTHYLTGGGAAYAAAYYTQFLALQRCRRVIAVSQSAAADVVRLAHVPAERVQVIYNAPSREMFVRPSAEALQQSALLQRIGSPYIFALLGPNPTKNVERLVAAFAQLPPDLQATYKLVITYRIPDWHRAAIEAWLKTYAVGDRVIFTDWVSREDLKLLFAGATLYVHPALYEGFGMPIIEAMALGTPALVSATSSMPEVVGDSGLTFDPYCVAAIAATITQGLRDANLRASLSRQSIARAQQFTWEQVALAVRQVYAAALADSPPACDAWRWRAGEDAAAAGAVLAQPRVLADVADRAYRVRSRIPLVGPIIAWILRNLTTHVREGYFDPAIEQQALFNQRIADALPVLARLLEDLGLAAQSLGNPANAIADDARSSLVAEATQRARDLSLCHASLWAGPLPEYGDCLEAGFYRLLYALSLIAVPDQAAEQCRENLDKLTFIQTLARQIEEYYEQVDLYRKVLLFRFQNLDPEIDAKGYQPQSAIPLVGKAITWLRRNLTSHLCEPYLVPILERQAAFNARVLELLQDPETLNPLALAQLHESAVTLLPAYTVRSAVPLLGPLIAGRRQHLTAHLFEPYILPLLKRQVAFDLALVEALTILTEGATVLALEGRIALRRRIAQLQTTWAQLDSSAPPSSWQANFETVLADTLGQMSALVEAHL